MIHNLNFGCGNKYMMHWDNADIQKKDYVDVSFDFNKYPYPLKKDYYSFVLIDNVLEHLENPRNVIEELHKHCIQGANIKIIVPYYNCSGAYNDMTHTHFFNEKTFDVYCNADKYYGEKNQKFRLKYIRLKKTRLGRLIPTNFCRLMASKVIGEVYSAVEVMLEVKK